MRFLAILIAAATVGDHAMVDDTLVGSSIEHHDELGYFMNVYDHRPTTLEFMEQHGLQGGGPTWRGLLTAALKLESPSSIGSLEFDDEADVLLVTSESRDVLQAAQSLASKLMNNPAFMVRCINEARSDGILE